MIFSFQSEYGGLINIIDWTGLASTVPSGVGGTEDRVNVGMRVGVNQADVLAGGFC
jgi:hypothetical protein